MWHHDVTSLTSWLHINDVIWGTIGSAHGRYRDTLVFFYLICPSFDLFVHLSVMDCIRWAQGHPKSDKLPRFLIKLTLSKNVLQFWLCYIRKMVQFHVLGLILSLTGTGATGHFTLPEMAIDICPQSNSVQQGMKPHHCFCLTLSKLQHILNPFNRLQDATKHNVTSYHSFM